MNDKVVRVYKKFQQVVDIISNGIHFSLRFDSFLKTLIASVKKKIFFNFISEFSTTAESLNLKLEISFKIYFLCFFLSLKQYYLKVCRGGEVLEFNNKLKFHGKITYSGNHYKKKNHISYDKVGWYTYNTMYLPVGSYIQ